MKKLTFLFTAILGLVVSYPYLITKSPVEKLKTIESTAKVKIRSKNQTTVSIEIYNTSQGNISYTLQNPNGTSYGGVINKGTYRISLDVVAATYNIILSPAGSPPPVNCYFSLSTGESYGPSPGHTFYDITVDSGFFINISQPN